MRAQFLIVAIAGALIFASSSVASEEGAFALRKFHFESSDESGPVFVSGTQNDKGIESLEIRALGKNFTLTSAHLNQLRGLIVNGVQLSGEGGYSELGGRTIYIKLSMGFTERIVKSQLVTVNERGDITIGNVESY